LLGGRRRAPGVAAPVRQARVRVIDDRRRRLAAGVCRRRAACDSAGRRFDDSSGVDGAAARARSSL
jgi:hypothetical protein